MQRHAEFESYFWQSNTNFHLIFLLRSGPESTMINAKRGEKPYNTESSQGKFKAAPRWSPALLLIRPQVDLRTPVRLLTNSGPYFYTNKYSGRMYWMLEIFTI